MTPADWRLIAAVALIGAILLGIFFVMTRLHGTTAQNATVTVQGETVLRLDISGAECEHVLSGVGMKLQYGGGRIRVIHSDCPEQVCVQTGWISNPGQSIVCLPNQTMIKLSGEGGPDAISR
ncbi:MAG TPA: hypothetical protein DHD79_07815 [Firmicutes bacterium]|jgi:heptaprenyl diphosphate synthase|nr:hypothetical protein [Bacillota bacterium]HBE05121.1 hypothetical protein [Bacillota bacterium]HBG44277.1 hypothetical protein [Bacillota bacterium]HBL69482.1 hypothetical protein [Bacillota bacterium]HBR24058.1 hypothetical protein [Bacillota bacterium]